MPIINSIEVVKLYVKVNFSNSVKSLPNFTRACKRYLIPFIGKELYNTVKDGESTDQELLTMCQAVVAPLTYFIELSTIQVQITDAGLRTVSTDSMAAAHRWEYNEVKKDLSDAGAFALEDLLLYLHENKEDYPEWVDSIQYKRLEKLLIRSGSEFSRLYPLLNPHRIYWQLAPLIDEVQDFYITPTIGKELLSYMLGVDAPNEVELEAIDLCKKAIAQYTIYKAILKLPCQLTEDGFNVLLANGNIDAVQQGKEAAPDTRLAIAAEACKQTGNAYLKRLKNHIDTNASATVFAQYFNSALYTIKNTHQNRSRNENRRGAFLI